MSHLSHSPQITIHEKPRKDRETRLRGRRLTLARLFWAIIALFELVALVDSLSGGTSHLRVLCTSSCANLQLSADGVALLQRLGLSLGDYIAFYLVVTLISVLLCYTVATLLVWRKSDDWLALLVSLMLMSFSSGMISNGVRFSQWVDLAWAGHLSSFFDEVNFTLLILVFLLFPDSRFVPRWMRWILSMPIGVGTWLVFFPRFASSLVAAISSVLFLSTLLSLVVSQVYRYGWVSTPTQRLQTRWIVYSLAVTIILLAGCLAMPQFAFPALTRPGELLSSLPDLVANALLTLIPLSFGIAILRYRLWDIDRLINRTLVYLTLTALLVLIYFGCILAMQYLLRGLLKQNNSVALVASTLAVAALFQPLRQRIQTMIDRRFYRRKYDAARILEHFSTALRSEVDLDRIGEHLLAAVQETMQPEHLSLRLIQRKIGRVSPVEEEPPSIG